MRKRASGMMLLAVLIVGLSADARAATEVQRFTFRGSQAAVGFFGSGTTSCADGSTGIVAASGFLSGAEQITRSTGTPQTISNGVLVEVDFFVNTCTGQSLGGAEGSVLNGFTPPDKKLTSSSLIGSTSVQDFSTGATIPVSINVTVQGTGTLSQSKSNSHSRTIGSRGGPLTISVDHSANSNRSGTATGTMSLDGAAIDAQFFFAILSADDNSSMTISKP
jgi:hypothetical protein